MENAQSTYEDRINKKLDTQLNKQRTNIYPILLEFALFILFATSPHHTK